MNKTFPTFCALLLLLLHSHFVYSKTATTHTKLFVNATIWTGVKDRPDASVLVIRDENIVFVGDKIPEQFAGLAPVDLAGRFVMHGFMDNHVHFMEGGAALASIDLREVASPDAFARKIAQHVKQVPKGQWVLNGNWDHENWGGQLPHKKWIDSNTKDNPVFVIRIDGHQALANTAALKAAGINKTTPNPEGGIIERDADGELTGIIKGNALNLLLQVIPPASETSLLNRFSLAQEHAFRFGISKVHAVTAYPTETTMLDMFKLARDSGIMKIRAKVSTPIESWQAAARVVSEQGYGDEWLSFGGVKGFIDGSLGARTAWFHEAYTDEEGYFGLPLNDPKTFAAWMKEADQAGLSLSIHALGDKGIDTVIDQMELIAGAGIVHKRYRIEHFQHPSKLAIQRLAKHKIIASMQPYHAVDDGRWAVQRLGTKRLATAYAFRSILDAGGILTFGSDWPVAPLSPFEGIYAAVSRQTLDGANPGGWIPEQKITVEEALTAYTRTNSYAFGTEQVAGTLEQGNFADFIVLSHDPRKVSVEAIRNIQVLRNYIGGNLVFQQ